MKLKSGKFEERKRGNLSFKKVKKIRNKIINQHLQKLNIFEPHSLNHSVVASPHGLF